MGEAPISIQGLSHCFGKGELRTQILCDIHTEIQAGEIVIMTGPSGSGKSTLLTLAGALRSAQEGSLRVLGEELRGAKPRLMESVRKQIGYIFQSHNLIEALTARQNVACTLLLNRERSSREARHRTVEMLEAEVNNGGYSQFFTNTSKYAVPYVVEALNKIGKTDAAELTQRAIDALEITGDLTVEAIDQAYVNDYEKIEERLEDCDERYFEIVGDLAEPVFKFIKDHKDKISVK